MQPLINTITGIIAPKGSGKTYYTVELIKSIDRLAVWDILHEQAYLNVADDLFCGEPKRFLQALQEPKFRLVYRPYFFEVGFDWFASGAYLAGNCTVVIEEVDQLSSPYYKHEWIDRLVNLGRHRQVSIIYLCRRMANIHRDLTANTNQFAFFKIIEPRDLEAVSDRCGMTVAEQVQNLNRLQIENGQVTVPGQRLTWSDTETEVQIK